MNFIELGLAVDIIGLGQSWRRGSSHQSIHQSRSIRDGEEQGSLVLFILDFSIFLILCHCQWHIHNFIFTLRVRIDFNKFFSLKVVELSLVADGNFDFPWLRTCIFNHDLLRNFFSDHTIKFQLLNRLLRLGNTLSY